MTEFEKLLEVYKALSKEEIHKVLIYVERLKTQHIDELDESHHQRE